MSRGSLGLPPGSVRACIALALVVAAIALTGYIIVTDRPPTDEETAALSALWGQAGLVTGFYFQQRQHEDREKAQREEPDA